MFGTWYSGELVVGSSLFARDEILKDQIASLFADRSHTK